MVMIGASMVSNPSGFTDSVEAMFSTEGTSEADATDDEQASDEDDAAEDSAPAEETPAQENSSPPPWEWIGFVALAVLGSAVAALLVFLLVRAVRRVTAKRKIAKRKAIEQKKLHARHREDWAGLQEKEKSLGKQWLQYEDSLELSLRYPVMRDLNDPKVAPVVAAMGRAKAYRTEEPPDLDMNPVETEYAKAVSEFEVALGEAERYARKTRWNHFAADEKKKAEQALKLLNLALDTANYPAERKTAYERVARIMEDLMIPVSPRALLSIEESVGRLELTAS